MILLLGGTGAARRLAKQMSPDVPLIASLSGATKTPKTYPCKTRIGGFGGWEAMAEWLSAHGISAIIDATHPYASQISANARKAAATSNTPLITLDRPPWVPRDTDNWRGFPALDAAVAALPTGARAFFATGRGGLDIICARTDIWAALRVVDDPRGQYPGNGEFIIARPPFDLDAEKALFALLGITHVVAKNAGGTAARTKLDAAAALRLPVFIIDRPNVPLAPSLSASAIPAWAKQQIMQKAQAS